MSDDIKIRLATSDDIGAIEQCVNRAYEMYVPRMGKKPAPMLADYRAMVGKSTVHVAQVGPGDCRSAMTTGSSRTSR